jgi:flagellar M-ring protein FliF
LIRQFIRGSYAGMRAEDVVVIDTNADPSVCPTNDPIARKQCEEAARLKQETLDILQGYGPIRVAAYIDIQRPINIAEAGPTIVRQATQMSSIEADRPEPKRTLLNELIDAVTHVSSNRATRLNAAAADASQKTTKVSVNKLSPDPPTLTSVRLSIGIPESYFQKVWQLSFLRDHPGKTIQDVPVLKTADLTALQQQTRDNITTAVTPALMSRVRSLGYHGSESTATVDVWSFPDLGEDPEPIPQPNQLALGFAWLSQSWRPLTIAGLACLALWLMLGGRRTSGKQQAASRSVATPEQHAKHPTNAADREINEELMALVDQDPDAAADTIRKWLADAA